MKLLLIEDDPDTAHTVKDILASLYTVEIALTGKDGLYKAKTNNYALIIIDLILGDTDGIAICQALRSKGKATPILILTGKYPVHYKVAALDAGADDYVTKPFNRAELLARIRALLRRPPAVVPSGQLRLQVGNLVMQLGQHTVTYQDKPIVLRRKEFNLLEYLMRHSGQVITRAMILDHVWESETDQLSNTVDVHIKHLRDKLDRRFRVDLIRTVPGIGYKLEP